MAKVFNSQIGREMDYPYKEAPSDKQIAWVFDTNKCIACQTCTMACKTTWTSGRGQEYMFWNNVETKPYGGYPTAWDLNILRKLGPQSWKDKVYTGKTIFEAAKSGKKTLEYLPKKIEWAYPNIGEDTVAEGKVDRGMHINTLPHPIWFFYLPRICNHCTYPACLAACPRKAIYKRKEDGIVLVDQKRCRGYKECVRACPYKKPMFRAKTKITEKCIACYPKVEKGIQTQCVETCIGKIRIQGWISREEEADPNNPIDYLVHTKKMALPLYPQFGTSPNVYNIPPIHVPTKYLTQMFGPGVEEAVSAYKNAKNDEKLKGLLMLFGSAPEIMTTFEVKGGEAIGYDTNGKEVARVPIKEPIVVRDEYDEKRDVYRLDVT